MGMEFVSEFCRQNFIKDYNVDSSSKLSEEQQQYWSLGQVITFMAAGVIGLLPMAM